MLTTQFELLVIGGRGVRWGMSRRSIRLLGDGRPTIGCHGDRITAVVPDRARGVRREM